MPATPSTSTPGKADRPKILHLITHLGVGGAQDNTLLTVKGHARDRYEVHLAAGQDYTDWVERGKRYADEFFLFPDLQRAANLQSDLRALNQLTAFIKQQGYQVVHTHSAKAGTLGRLAARRANVPVIVHTFHSFGWQVARTVDARPWQKRVQSLKETFYILLERYAASLSDGLITVSELNRQEALSIKLARPDKFMTIYSGIDLNRFQVTADRRDIRRGLGVAPDRPLVGTIGRLSEQKAPLDFVAAARQVLRHKPDVQFIMVGDGPLAVEVHRAIGDESRIRVLGYREDIPEILSALDLFVLSSLWEGLGRALTEAMIMGVPAAATAVDGVPELVSHMETGLLSPPGDPAALASNILWALDHPAEVEQMRRRARDRVVPAFGAERMVAQIEALYGRLLAEKGIQTA